MMNQSASFELPVVFGGCSLIPDDERRAAAFPAFG